MNPRAAVPSSVAYVHVRTYVCMYSTARMTIDECASR